MEKKVMTNNSWSKVRNPSETVWLTLNRSFCRNFHARLAYVCHNKLVHSSVSGARRTLLLCMILLCSEVNIFLNAPVTKSIRVTTPYALTTPVKEPDLGLLRRFAPILSSYTLGCPDSVYTLIPSIPLIAEAIPYLYLYTTIKGAFWVERQILLPHLLIPLSQYLPRGPPQTSPTHKLLPHSSISFNPQNRFLGYAPFDTSALRSYKNLFTRLIIIQKYTCRRFAFAKKCQVNTCGVGFYWLFLLGGVVLFGSPVSWMFYEKNKQLSDKKEA